MYQVGLAGGGSCGGGSGGVLFEININDRKREREKVLMMRYDKMMI